MFPHCLALPPRVYTLETKEKKSLSSRRASDEGSPRLTVDHFSSELRYIWPRDVFQFTWRLAVSISYGCIFIPRGVERGGLYTQKRLVRRGTLSLKYPEVFFPWNRGSPSFPVAEYPWISCEDREVTQPHLFVPSFVFPFLSSVSAREAIYTRLRLANSHPLLEDDKASKLCEHVSACMRKRTVRREFMPLCKS